MNVRWIFPAGKLVANEGLLGAVATKTFTVPDGKKWILLYGYTQRDVNATFVCELFDDAQKLTKVVSAGAGVTAVFFPGINGNITEFGGMPFILDEAWRIIFTYGVAQTNPRAACVVLEIGK